MHLNDGQIQRLMHGELDAAARDAVTRHAAECATCAQALADAEREEAVVFDLLERVDHEALVVDAARIAGAPREGHGAWGRRVAGIVIVAALAGAAYAIPGSPLPSLVKKLATMITGERVTTPAGDDEPSPASPATSGIAVPAGDQFVVAFVATQDSGMVTVSFTDEPTVRVRVVGGSATFTTDAARLTIGNRNSSANYEMNVPRGDLSRVHILVAGAEKLRSGSDAVEFQGSQAAGKYFISLAPHP